MVSRKYTPRYATRTARLEAQRAAMVTGREVVNVCGVWVGLVLVAGDVVERHKFATRQEATAWLVK